MVVRYPKVSKASWSRFWVATNAARTFSFHLIVNGIILRLVSSSENRISIYNYF